MPNNVLLQQVYLLHLKAYRNTSALIEVFSADYGRVCLVARGVRKKKSQLQGLLQPFTPLLMSWRGRGDLMTMHTAEINGTAHLLKGDALLSAMYLNEILLYLLIRFDPHPDLYSYYSHALSKLEIAKGRHAIEAVLRYFEKHLLQELGYGLTLDHDVESGLPIRADCTYRYKLGYGPVLHRDSQPSKGGEFCLQGKTLLQFNRNALTEPQAFKEVKYLMRAAIEEQLGGKVLNSRKLFKSYE